MQVLCMSSMSRALHYPIGRASMRPERGLMITKKAPVKTRTVDIAVRTNSSAEKEFPAPLIAPL